MQFMGAELDLHIKLHVKLRVCKTGRKKLCLHVWPSICLCLCMHTVMAIEVQYAAYLSPTFKRSHGCLRLICEELFVLGL